VWQPYLTSNISDEQQAAADFFRIINRYLLHRVLAGINRYIITKDTGSMALEIIR
jgi:hypothetical protein